MKRLQSNIRTLHYLMVIKNEVNETQTSTPTCFTRVAILKVTSKVTKEKKIIKYPHDFFYHYRRQIPMGFCKYPHNFISQRFPWDPGQSSVPLVCLKGRPKGVSHSGETSFTEAPCQSRYGTMQIPLNLKATWVSRIDQNFAALYRQW